MWSSSALVPRIALAAATLLASGALAQTNDAPAVPPGTTLPRSTTLAEAAAERDACVQLRACFLRLKLDLCLGGDRTCETTFALASNATPERCRDDLADVGLRARPYVAGRDSFTVPSECTQ